MKISHEVPLSLLEESKSFNDYDYCLVHLLDKYPEYRDFYKDSNREVILDNSIFELGEAYNDEDLIYHINDIKPTYYIIPDVLEDCSGTIERAKRFLDKAGNIKSKTIGVVQGKTYEELVKCHEFMDKEANVDKIAISFDYSYYERMFDLSAEHAKDLLFTENDKINKYLKWKIGRFLTLSDLYYDKVINKNKPYHLLGCSLPQEGTFYKHERFKFIDSVDTSNPIVHGIKNIKYTNDGLTDKQSVKLADLMEEDVKLNNIIKHNLKIFRKFWG